MKRIVFAALLLSLSSALSADSTATLQADHCQALLDTGEAFTSKNDQDLRSQGVEKIRRAFKHCNSAEVPVALRARRLLLAERLPEMGREDDIRHQTLALTMLREESPDHPLILEALMELSSSYIEGGELTPALDLAFDALAERKRLFGDTSQEYVQGLIWTSVIYVSTEGDSSSNPYFQSAYEYALEAVELSSRLFGAQAPTTLDAKGNLAAVFKRMGRDAEATALYDELLESPQEDPPDSSESIGSTEGGDGMDPSG